MEINVQRIKNNALRLADDLAGERVHRDDKNLKARVNQFAVDADEINTRCTGVLCGCLMELAMTAQEIMSCSDADYAAKKPAYEKQLRELYASISKHSDHYRLNKANGSAPAGEG